MDFVQGNNLPRVKVANHAGIRRLVYYHAPISRGAIAEQLGLTIPTITTNVASLIGSSFIREVGTANEGAMTMGRRVKLLDIVPDARYFLGVELRGTLRCLVITDYRGSVVYSRLDEVPCYNYDEAIQMAAKMITAAMEETGFPKEKLGGIGVCVPGLVDSREGILRRHPGYCWTDKNIVLDIQKLTGYTGPVMVENNACARAFAAQLFRRDLLNGVPSFAYMFIATGIACPLIYNFVPGQGVMVGAGEVGHMVMDPEGPLCSCGNRGCLETFSSDKTVLNRCEEVMRMGEAPTLREICSGHTMTMEDVILAQKRGEQGISRILETAITSLGIAIANIDNFARPHMILIDGSLFTLEENRKRLLEVVKQNQYTATAMDTDFEFILPDLYSGAKGGAAIAIRQDLETYIG